MPGPRTTSRATTRGTTERVLAQFQVPQKIGSDRRGETGGVRGKYQGKFVEIAASSLGAQRASVDGSSPSVSELDHSQGVNPISVAPSDLRLCTVYYRHRPSRGPGRTPKT